MSSASNTSNQTADQSARTIPKKDYASAFASLQTQFGAGGHAPCQPPPPASPAAQSKHKATPTKGLSQPSASTTSQPLPNNASKKPKDYAAALGYLQSQFGASGHAPYHPSMKDSKKP